MQYFQKIKSYILLHKFVSTIVVLTVLYGGYYEYKKLTDTSGETRYVTAQVKKGTIITSITGSGQVSASNQVDVKPKVSGDVVYVNVVSGQTVKAGAVLATLDSRDAQKAVRDAEVNLESAKLSLEKLQKPADELSVTQSENTLARAKESKENATNDLANAYENGFNTVSNAFLDLPAIMTSLQNMLYSSSLEMGASGQNNIDYYTSYAAIAEQDKTKADSFKADVDEKYNAARVSYDKNFQDFKTTNRSSDTEKIETLVIETYETTKNVAEAVKSANNLIQYYKDKLTEKNLPTKTLADTHLASLGTYTGKTNTHLINLLGVTNTITDDKNTITNATRTIDENTKSLTKLESGADVLDVKSSELSVKQRENALLDAKEKLADYSIRAPFGGTIAKMNVKKGDSLTSGTAVATLVTAQKIAELSLNEVDVAKVKVGQKATLTFDAIEGLSIAGAVSDIDTIGTVSQGVVTYTVKIGFDTQDDRVKPGMSVSAAIITDIKQDVLTVPSSAVKTQGNANYVEMFDTPLPQTAGTQGSLSAVPPRQQNVAVGLSSDTDTEIVSGLKEGDEVVSRTITAKTTTTATAPSLFGGGGTRGLGGGR
jgi:HlyD family secretion protein